MSTANTNATSDRQKRVTRKQKSENEIEPKRNGFGKQMMLKLSVTSEEIDREGERVKQAALENLLHVLIRWIEKEIEIDREREGHANVGATTWAHTQIDVEHESTAQTIISI